MNAIQNALGWHSIIDWLTVIAVLLVAVVGAIVWLGLSVAAQFRHHDRDLRAEVEKVNKTLAQLMRLN